MSLSIMTSIKNQQNQLFPFLAKQYKVRSPSPAPYFSGWLHPPFVLIARAGSHHLQQYFRQPFCHMLRPPKISISQLNEQYQAVEIEPLGKGTSGSVYVYRRRADSMEVALKIVKTDKNCKREQALGEIQILSLLQHQRIVKIFKYYEETFISYTGEKRYEIGLLLERGIGSLQHCFKDRNYKYSFEDILRFIVKFIELGAYLQLCGYVHRDIKPGNIIIFDDRLEFKLGDFGLGCRAYERPRGFAGTPAYCSPGLKKFWKDGNHRQRPCTNAFKDDVYSFALTSQEVIKHRFSLEECPREITALLDEMLKNDERERPTFTHLMHHQTVQKYLRECQGQEETERDRENHLGQRDRENIKAELIDKVDSGQPFTRRKQPQGEFSELDHHTQRSKKIKEQSYIKCPKGLRTFANIHEKYLIAGTNQGQLWVIFKQSGECINLTLSHKNYVGKVTVDRNGDIWSAGGDGKIFFIERQSLIKCIQNNKTTLPQPTKKKVTFLSLPPPPPLQVINIPQQIVETIIDNPEQPFASELFSIDRNHFAVGYCSGAIRVRWGQDPSRIYRIHSKPITALKVTEEMLYSADFDGNVKLYNLSKKLVQRTIYKFNPQLLDIAISPVEAGMNIDGISCRGNLQTINLYKSCRTTFNAELPAKNLVAATFTQKQYYFVTNDGRIFFKNTPFVKLDGHGWNSIVEILENQIIVGGQDGSLCLITVQ